MSEFTTKKLFADLKVLVDDVERLLSATEGEAGERVTDLRQRLARRVEEGKAALGQQETALREHA
jgi:ElaB/YqjD/DUF883 family membrane-anchored ribosome-binding protein